MNIFSTKIDITKINKEDWFDFEKQFLKQVSLTVFGFAFVSLVLNILMKFNEALFTVPLIAMAVFLIVYFMAYYNFHVLFAKWLFIITALAVVNLVWYYNYGSNGPWFFLLILLYSYLIFMMNGKQLLLLSIALILNAVVLFFYEYIHPGVLGDYPNDTMRLFDFYTAILMSGITAYVLMSLAKNSYLTQYQKAKIADKLKSSFLANMSHEIRTPLNAIVGFSNLLADGTIKEEERDEYISIINNSNQTLLQLIDDILDVSLIEADQVKIKKSDFLINDLMQNLEKTYIPVLKEKKQATVRLKLKLPKKLFWINSDPIRINQVMVNLLNNAIKFTNTGSIEFGFELKNNDVRFFVKDTGIGIEQKHLEHLFDRFYKIEDDNKKLYRGTGIGLYLCRKIVELLGGTIQVNSVYGKESEFYFYVPAENLTVKSASSHKKAQIHSTAENRHSKGTILIIEDDPSSMVYFKKVLEEINLNILEAGGAEEGIRSFMENTDILVVLLDIRLPEVSGFDILKDLKKIRPEVPVIAQTAFAMAGDKENCLAAGFDDYISKPVSKDTLIRKLQKFI
jgi:signal transduction histidine kinase/CheY-like chemotaxis protein